MRMAMRWWADTYLPDSDGEDSVMGMKIPGFAMMKQMGLGLWNFFTIGLPELWNRLTLWSSELNDKLFGEEGMFSSLEDTKITIKKIIFAIIKGKTKKLAKGGFAILNKVVGWIAKPLNIWIPGAGAVLVVIVKILEELYKIAGSFIFNKIMDAQNAAEKTSKDQHQYIAKLTNREQM